MSNLTYNGIHMPHDRWIGRQEPTRPMIYVAGPMTSSGNPYQNIRDGIATGFEIFDLGGAPFIPHLSAFQELQHNGLDWDDWIAFDKEIILRCDAIFRLPGASKGADAEETFCLTNNIPVFKDWEELRKYINAYRSAATVTEPEHLVRNVSFPPYH